MMPEIRRTLKAGVENNDGLTVKELKMLLSGKHDDLRIFTGQDSGIMLATRAAVEASGGPEDEFYILIE